MGKKMLYGEAMRRVEEGEGCPALLEGIGTVMGVYGVVDSTQGGSDDVAAEGGRISWAVCAGSMQVLQGCGGLLEPRRGCWRRPGSPRVRARLAAR